MCAKPPETWTVGSGNFELVGSAEQNLLGYRGCGILVTCMPAGVVSLKKRI